ncbi:MAG: iron-sulfur cluster biosynthesis transcriptional regulator SufR [Thermostichus sp. DG_1_6_bins_120]|uniref:iron-sulfur cluster biosynthesis transcriptional regulator SufR n=1 Tax=uncultured Thermosynechococcus sp. TaxID=436945 RepID=UPI00260CD7B3|nr:iron-sulfur cluster biosynthesis transcriptional regulator SufR [uncultured Thermosynechococcus sp.]
MNSTHKTTQQTSSKQAILIYLRKAGHANAQMLAEHLQISPQAIRRHLKDLETEGLIAHIPQQNGLGRPQYLYQLSPQGEEQFPDSYDEFALGLLKTLAETVGSEQMGSILQQQWQRKAQEYRSRIGSGSLRERVERLVELRQSEGYMAEYYPCLTEQSEQYILVEHNCAIAQVAQTFPSVCGYELEMFALALPDCRVERINWQVKGEHQCGYRIAKPFLDPT